MAISKETETNRRINALPHFEVLRLVFIGAITSTCRKFYALQGRSPVASPSWLCERRFPIFVLLLSAFEKDRVGKYL